MVCIRAFNLPDKEDVRQICCDVADKGERIENFFPDRVLAADLLTSYYTDYEPQSTFVAQENGRVVAYISGCLDNRRFGLVMLFLIIPRLILKGLARGGFSHREFWQILNASLRNWRRLISWRKESFHSHQGHIHIGVSKEFRGQGIGDRLVEAFFSYAGKTATGQITASVHDGNSAACRFFERLGFTVQESHPMVMSYQGSLKKYEALCYVKSVH